MQYLLYDPKPLNRMIFSKLKKFIVHSNTIALKHIKSVNAALQIMRKHYNKHAEFTRYWKEVQLTLICRNRSNAKQLCNIVNLMKAYESAIAAESKELSSENKVLNKVLEKNGLKRTRSQSNRSNDSRLIAKQSTTSIAEPNKPKKSRTQTSAIAAESKKKYASRELRSSQNKIDYNLRKKNVICGQCISVKFSLTLFKF